MAFDIDNRKNKNRFSASVFHERDSRALRNKFEKGVQKAVDERIVENFLKMIQEAEKLEKEISE